jgi:hypothetical protein
MKNESISPQNVEIRLNNNKAKVVNVNNIKKNFKNISGERVRTSDTITRSVRIFKALIH